MSGDDAQGLQCSFESVKLLPLQRVAEYLLTGEELTVAWPGAGADLGQIYCSVLAV